VRCWLEKAPILIAYVVGLAAVAGVSRAQTVTLEAEADSYLVNGGANQNQGGESFLRVRSSGKNRALVRFDQGEIAGAVGSGTLVTARLELFIEDNGDNWGSSGRTVSVHRLETAWTESGVTWNCPDDASPQNSSADCPAQWFGGTLAPAETGAALHTNGLAGRVAFDVTADVAAFLAGTANSGWLVKLTNEGQNGNVSYTSRDGAAGQTPRLVLEIESAAADATPPTLAVRSPESIVVGDDTPEIAVEYADGGSGVDLGSLLVRVDGGDVTDGCAVAASSAVCEPPPLAAGVHLVTAEVGDLAGNLASAELSFELLLGEGPHTVSFPAVADTYLRQGSPNQSQGDEALLRIQSSGHNRALVRFDAAEVAAVVGEAAMVGATLELFVEVNAGNWGTEGRTIDAHRLLSGWSESGATWNCADDAEPTNQQPDCDPRWDGGAYEAEPTSTVLQTSELTGPVTFDVTADVAALFTSGAVHHGWLVRKSEEGQNGHVEYTSREGTAGQGPRLTVAFEPVEGPTDTTAPVLVITSPPADAEIEEPGVVISLAYSDAGSGLDLGSLRVAVDGFYLAATCSVEPGSATCPTPSLTADRHVIAATIRDLAGNAAVAEIGFDVLTQTADKTAPTIAITSPPGPEIVDDPTPEFVVEYGDVGSGISLVDFEFLIDGVDVTAGCVVDVASAVCEPPPLALGEHVVLVRVADLAFNLAEVSVQVTISSSQPERELPTLAITSPASGAVLDEPAIEISLSYSDPGSGIDLRSLRVGVDAFELSETCSVGPTSATCATGPLAAGAHRVWAEVGDLHGNRLLARSAFEIGLTAADTEAPAIVVASPAAGAVVEDPQADVRVQFADSGSGVDVSTLEVLVDGGDLTLDCEVTASSAACTSPSLEQGSHALEIRIRDLAGNLAEESVVFEVDLLAFDTVAPRLAIRTPEAAAGVAAQLLTAVVVDYSDGETGIDLSTVRVRLDGADLTSCSVGAVSAACPVPTLALGAHDVAAEVRDRNGNAATASLTFIVIGEQVPPVVTVLSPASERIVGAAAQDIVVGYQDASSGIDLTSLRVTLDGADLTGDCTAEPQQATCPTPPLTAGFHVLTAEILDQLGNRGNVTFLFEVLFDLDVAVTSPESGLLIREATVEVSGSVSPETESVEVSGVTAELDGGAFTARDVPVDEGNNTLSVIARTASGGIGTASVDVIRDTDAPRVVVRSPRDGTVTGSAQVTVTGELIDPSISTGRVPPPAVTVNGIAARLEQRNFILTGLLLVPGENVLRVTAADAAGNTRTEEVRVVFDAGANPRLEEVLGSGQEGRVGETLDRPLVVRVSNAFGQPLPGRRVSFEVTRGNGEVSAFPQAGRRLTVRSDEQGLAEVAFQLGGRSGAGLHEVTATTPGFPVSVVFCASARAGEPQRIVRIVGGNQLGAWSAAVGAEAPFPLLAQVFDARGNPVAGVDVTYQVEEGSGSFSGGSLVVATDSEGKAAARFRLGPEPGINNNVVSASFEGLAEAPATFVISGLEPGPEEATEVRGLVLDNEDNPVPGVTLHITDTTATTWSNVDGRFILTGVPVGNVHLEVFGASTSRPGTWPQLAFVFNTVSGQTNELGMPIRLLPLDDDSARVVGGPEDVTIPVSGVAGAELTVFADSVTFPDGSRTGTVTVTQVHGDKVPMQAPMGSSFMLAWTVQPAGVRFDPPARISIPNTGGDPPGTVVDVFSFDHDVGEFVAIGTASVTPDGARVLSNPGSGVVKSGWHGCVPPPSPPADACNPGACTFCLLKGTGSRCDPVCEICTGGGCEDRKLTKVTIKANGKSEDDKLIVGLEQEVTFRATGLTGNLKETCTDLSYEWDFDDMEMGTNQEEKHEYKEAKSYMVKLTVTCGACPGAMVEDTIKVKVIDFTPEGHFQRLDTSSEEMLDEVKEDLDGDGKDDRFFRVLGGVRQRLEALEHPDLAGRVKEYKWSAAGGSFFDGFKTTAMGLAGADLEGASKKEIFWEGEWLINQDFTVEIEATLDDDVVVIGKKRLRTRQLKEGEEGDDVRMLQHLLRMFGLSSKGSPGYAGTAVPVASGGPFGPQTSKAVRRFRVRDDLPTCTPASGEKLINAYKRCIGAASEIVDNSVLEALEKHWEDFQKAVEAYDTHPNVLLTHASVPSWANTTATLLQNSYSLPIHATVAPASPYVDLVMAWVRKEGGLGHWGRSIPFRIVLGGADELGSIGFTQIINTHKYGTNNIATIEATNLYDPEKNMNALAVFSNDSAAFSRGGGGMYKAFLEPNAAQDYQVSTTFTSYPRIGADYTDDAKDRLSKGIMAYNRGPGLSAFFNDTWPEILKENIPPDTSTSFGTRTAIRYSLTIQSTGGISLRCWDWTDLVITTGADEICDSVPFVDPADLAVTPQPIGLPGNKVCVIPNVGDPIRTIPFGNDVYGEFTFEYCETDFVAGRAWHQVWVANLPFRIP